MSGDDRRRNPFTELLAVRVDPKVVELIGLLAWEENLTDGMLIEQLVFEKARDAKLLASDDAWARLMALQGVVAAYLEKRDRKGDIGPDITLDCFEYLRNSPEVRPTHTAAIRPPRGISPEKRRQYVHQRIGRFIKRHLDLESGGEVLLPPKHPALIRSYTRLVPKPPKGRR